MSSIFCGMICDMVFSYVFNVSYVTPDPEGKNERVFQFVCFVLHFCSSLCSVMNFRYTVFQLVV